MLKRKSIFIKLFLTTLLILLSSLIFFGVVFNYLVHNVFLNSAKESLKHQREQLAYHINLANEENWDEKIVQASLELTLNQEDKATFVFDHQANLTYQSEQTDIEDLIIDRALIQKALNGEEVTKRIRANNHYMFVVAAPMQIESADQHNHVIVSILHGFDREASQIKIINLVALLITVVFTGMIIFFVSRKITSPLRELNHAVLKFAKGDFSNKVKITTNDEIGQLGNSVNYMAKELSSIDQMRKDFVANVSHDLRSPLTSIKGFLVALLDGTIPDQRRSHYLTIMKSETERLIKLVNDLLDMTKLESNELQIHRKSYNISEQVRQVIAKMEPELSKHLIEVEMPDEKDYYVFADTDRIEQVLINLLQNAIHFSKQQEMIYVRMNHKNEDAIITIEDHGKGISEDELERIWERFYKVDKSRTNNLGTGIGLSIVKQIIDLHDSSIHVESEVGIGTKFTFTLPLSGKE
ncbi:sensor histidine kinase [Halalkalibacter alkalisediminis]|uniref:histidine kinase n=1 Tax=Halalkalibacter alkalisediminis TaxID=935616 RepID=A0ABV6NJ91_9BACI|nr:HAMP domain-containing sensor histidine kinase [Halalkalibacter alkalisediminis]